MLSLKQRKALSVLMWSALAFTAPLKAQVFAQVEPAIQREDISITLGSRRTVLVEKLKSESDLYYSLTELEAVDPQGWVQLEMRRIPETLQIELEVSVPYSSPSFSARQIRLVEADEVSGEVLKVTEVNLEVQPVVRIQFWGNEQEEMFWDSPQEIRLQRHEPSVTVVFENVVSNGMVHRIHAEGAIGHAPRDSLLSEAGASYIYEVVTDTDQVIEGRYRCHMHYNGPADLRKIKFNVSDLEELRGAAQFPQILESVN